MALSRHHRQPVALPRDFAGMSKLTPQDKARLLRERFLELGADVACRRLSGTSQSLPPASDIAMLFGGWPAAIRLWGEVLLRIFPPASVQIAKKNLIVARKKIQAADAVKEKENRNRKWRELNERLASRGKELENLNKIFAAKESLLGDVMGKGFRRFGRRHGKSEEANRIRTRRFGSERFLGNETRTLESKLNPMLARLTDFAHVLTNAAGNGSANNDKNGNCRRDLNAILYAFRARFARELDDAGSARADESLDGSTDSSTDSSADFSHFQLVRSLLRNHARSAIVDAFVSETAEGVERLKDAEAHAVQSDSRDSSILDYSIDESGFVVDESARREEKELKQRRTRAKTQLYRRICHIEDETAHYHQRAAELTLPSAEIEASLLQRTKQKSLQLLREELRTLERLVEEAQVHESAIREKRKKVEATKDAMKFTDNAIAFLARESKRRHERVENGEEDGASFDLTSMKADSNEIHLKSKALEHFGQQALTAWSTIAIDNLSAQPWEGSEASTTACLVRDVDVGPRFADATSAALEECLGISRVRPSLTRVVDALMAKDANVRRREAILTARPDVGSLTKLEEALDGWEAYKAKNGGTSRSNNEDGGDLASYLGISVKRSGREAEIAETKEVMGRVMEKCVQLADAEKTLAEAPGFTVLPDVKIDGKNWAEWRAELNDAKMRHYLAKK